jgi:predicted ester cyclase
MLNSDIIQRIFDATNRQDLDELSRLYAPAFTVNGAPTAFAQFAANLPAFFAAFPDAIGTIDELVQEGDRVVARWTTVATHLGTYAGALPTGRRVTWSGINVYAVTNGCVVAMWQSADTFGLLQQIDAVLLKAEAQRPEPKSTGLHERGIFSFQVKRDPSTGQS